MTLPPGLAALALLNERVPGRGWDARLVVQCADDFRELDVPMVAGRCAAYLAVTPKARNGPRTLRTFLERERAELRKRDRRSADAARLAHYDHPRNRRQP